MRENGYLVTPTEVYTSVPIQHEEMKYVTEEGVEAYYTFQDRFKSVSYSLDGSKACFSVGFESASTMDDMNELAVGYGLTFGRGLKNIDKDVVQLMLPEVRKLKATAEWSKAEDAEI